jgi:hypothetical protein
MRGAREASGWVKMPVRDVVVVAVGDGWEEVRYCCTEPDLKLNISRSLDRPLLLLWTASGQCLEDDEVMVKLPELFDPKLLLSESEEVEVSLDTDCFNFLFCNSLLEAEETGVSRKPSLVALWNAS